MLLKSCLLPGLTVFRAVAENETVRAWQGLTEALTEGDPKQILHAYHRFLALAASKPWPGLLVDLILTDDNIFSRTAATQGVNGISSALKEIVARDLNMLYEVGQLTAQRVKEALVSVFQAAGPEWNLPPAHPLHPDNWPEWETDLFPAGIPNNPRNPAAQAADATCWLNNVRHAFKAQLAGKPWAACVELLASFYEQVGCGMFSHVVAAQWQPTAAENFVEITNPDPIRLSQLIGLEHEKQLITENTNDFLTGLPANNIILYGHRGTGKSSMVKALLNAYAHRDLRLVEIAKADLPDFPLICSRLAGEPAKFILFIDDLSFEENEPEYKALKTMLEGGIAARPANVLIYATSNRRHLVKETHSERQSDIHSRDGQEEKLSLADRFGITITFPSPDQAAYLEIVEALAGQSGLLIKGQELRQLALRWEMWHNGRSGRTARQFIDHLNARQASRAVID